MSKFLVETHYTCTFKIVHELDELNEKSLSEVDNRKDGKVEIVNVTVNNRKTKKSDGKNIVKSDLENLKISHSKEGAPSEKIRTELSKKNNKINIAESNTLDLVDWDIFNPSILKNLNTLLNKFAIDKLNEYKNKVKQYKSNLISIKKVRKAEKLLSNIYSGFILSVQSYGFFVEISELNVEGLVHVSTLNNDWYEYRSRQNLLIGRKSKKSYKVGDQIEVKIIKVDILKYQIDLELT